MHSRSRPARVALLAWLVAPSLAFPQSQAPPAPLIFGGGDASPPFEFKDVSGVPRGVNIDLAEALARAGGRRLEIRLGKWSEIRGEVEAGRIDLMMMAHTSERATKVAFLEEAWTVRLAVFFPVVRKIYPASVMDLASETVAVQEGEMTHELLLALPDTARPKILAVRDHDAAIGLVRSREATAIAGNDLVIRTALARFGVTDVQSVPVRSASYQLVTAKGREKDMEWVGPALARMRASGDFRRVVESHMSEPPESRGLREFVPLVASFFVALAAVLLGSFLWTRSLRAQVAARTLVIGQASAEKDRLTQSLLEREERYRAFVAHSNEGIWRWEFKAPFPKGASLDEQFEYFFENAYVAECNDAMARLYDLEKADELTGRLFKDVRRLRTVVSNTDNLRAFIANSYLPTEWETQWIDKTGSPRWSASSAVGIVKDGALIRTWSTQRDITRQKLAEEGLRHALSLVRATLDSATDGILVENMNGGIVDVNERFGAMWRVPPEMLQPATRHVRALSEHARNQLADPENFSERAHEILSQPEGESYDVLRLKDGRVFERYSRPQRLGDTTVGRVWSFRDVTERERSMIEIQEANRLLEVKNAELERFTYTVSHDLKSPLITIRGYMGHLEASAIGGDMEAFKEDAARINRAAAKMEDLLRDLLELSRVGRVLNPDENVKMAEVAQDVADLLRGPLIERGVRLEIESGLPTVRGDRRRLVEVVQNLVENATKFMGAQKDPCVRVGARNVKGETVLFVSDNGIGIDAKHREKVFELFEKLTPETEGTGVGLALVKRIVEAHGGRVWVESEGPGHGSTFCFTLRSSE